MQILIKALFMELKKIYIKGLKKHPKCTNLRISYFLFQLERLNRRQVALQELFLAEKSNPKLN